MPPIQDAAKLAILQRGEEEVEKVAKRAIRDATDFAQNNKFFVTAEQMLKSVMHLSDAGKLQSRIPAEDFDMLDDGLAFRSNQAKVQRCE